MTTANADTAKLVEEVRALDREWAQAVLRADAATLERIFADDLTYVHGNAKTETKKEFIARIASRSLAYKKVQLGDANVRIYGDTAVDTGTFEASVDVDGKPVDAKVTYLRVYVRQGGRFRLVAHQVTTFGS
jgi:uncharacterized protein (TIGR02246 family)